MKISFEFCYSLIEFIHFDLSGSECEVVGLRGWDDMDCCLA